MNLPQIEIIEGASSDVFDYLVYAPQSPETQRYIQAQFDNISPHVSAETRRFLEESRALSQKFYDPEAKARAEAALRRAKGVFNPNLIRRFDDLVELRTMSPLNQRYLMADVQLRELYHRQRLAGFGESYVDMDPGKRGVDHYDWRRVNNGMLQEEGDECHFTQWIEDLREGDRELTKEEQMDIIHSQRLARLFLAHGIDATDEFGGGV